MRLIVKQRTGCVEVIVDLTGHKQELILDRIPERRYGLSERSNSARAITDRGNTVIVIARADNLLLFVEADDQKVAGC